MVRGKIKEKRKGEKKQWREGEWCRKLAGGNPHSWGQ